MKAPRCLECGKPVKPSRSNEPIPKLRGPRIVDGVRYRWYCSRTCNGRANGSITLPRERIVALARERSEEGERKRLRAIVELCKDHMTASGFVPAKVMARTLIVLERKAYQRGYEAGGARSRWRDA